MSPEQLRGDGHVLDHRTDVYSLGATLYEMLTLEPMFPESDTTRLMHRIEQDEPVAPSKLDRAIMRDLETIVLQAIAKEPESRYQSAGDMARDLRHFLDDKPILAKPPGVVARCRKWARRHRSLVTATAVTLAITVAAAGVLLWRERSRTLDALAAQIAANQEAQRQKKISDENFQLARDAVDKYFTHVSENELLGIPSLQPLRKELLELSLQYYQDFIDQHGEDDPTLQADLAAAYSRVGKITAEIGSTYEAIQAHEKAVEIWRRLAAGGSDELPYRNRVSISYSKLGRLYGDVGKYGKALDVCRKAIQARERLLEEHPDRLALRSNLAVDYRVCGGLYRDMQQYSQALDLCQKSIAAFEQLVAEHPDDSRLRQNLAQSFTELGLAYSDTRRRDDALACHRKALEMDAKLVEEYPDDLVHQSNLATAHFNLGLDQEATGRSDAALANYQAAIAIEKQLAAENPKVRDFQTRLASFDASLGKLQRATGRRDEALIPSRSPSRSNSGWSPTIPRYTTISTVWPFLTEISAACKWKWGCGPKLAHFRRRGHQDQ